MNKITKKIIICCLCISLAIGGTFTASALTGGREETPEKENEETAVLTEEGTDSVEKDETVYVLAGADGRIQKIIVSDWLKNTLGAEKISDMSELADIENVKGDETYTADAGNVTLWDAEGNDIYYQGNIEKELPVDINVTYTLNGKKMSPEEIAGQSGRVSIRFDYVNRQYEMLEVDGRQEKIYVPFAMLTGTVLDNDIFRNVEVTNGKIINDGDRTLVAGVAFPGLQEDLGVDSGKLNIPDYVEISADATGFEFGMTFTVATNEVFSNLDVSKISSVSELTEKLGDLTESLAELTDGMNQLYGGTVSLEEGSNKLSDGIGQLSDGLNTLSSNSGALNSGAKQVFEALLKTASEQIRAAGVEIPDLTIDNYASVLGNALGLTDEDSIVAIARQKVEEAVRAQTDTVRAAVTSAVKTEVETQVKAAVREYVLGQVLEAQGLSAEKYSELPEIQKVLTDLIVDQQMATDDVKATIQEKTDEQMASEQIKAIIETNTEEQIQLLIDQNMASEEVQKQITEGVAKANAGAESLAGLKAQLDAYNSFYKGLKAYTSGVDSAANGAAQIKSSMPEFVSGVQKLREGVKQMLDGLNSSGLEDISIESIFSRLKATENAARNYRSFSGISDEMDGQVKFIYRTDEVRQ